MRIPREHFESRVAPNTAITLLTAQAPLTQLSSREEKLNREKNAALFSVQTVLNSFIISTITSKTVLIFIDFLRFFSILFAKRPFFTPNWPQIDPKRTPA